MLVRVRWRKAPRVDFDKAAWEQMAPTEPRNNAGTKTAAQAMVILQKSMRLLGVIKYMAGRLTDMQYFGPGIILRPSDIHWLEPRLVFPYNEILTKLLNSQEQPRTTS